MPEQETDRLWYALNQALVVISVKIVGGKSEPQDLEALVQLRTLRDQLPDPDTFGL